MKETSNTYISAVQEQTHQWRMQKWPDVTPMIQLAGTDVEVSELMEMEVKGATYDDAWMSDEQLKKEIGDVMIYLMGYASLHDLDITDCLESALDKNQARNWEEHQKAPSDD